MLLVQEANHEIVNDWVDMDMSAGRRRRHPMDGPRQNRATAAERPADTPRLIPEPPGVRSSVGFFHPLSGIPSRSDRDSPNRCGGADNHTSRDLIYAPGDELSGSAHADRRFPGASPALPRRFPGASPALPRRFPGASPALPRRGCHEISMAPTCFVPAGVNLLLVICGYGVSCRPASRPEPASGFATAGPPIGASTSGAPVRGCTRLAADQPEARFRNKGGFWPGFPPVSWPGFPPVSWPGFLLVSWPGLARPPTTYGVGTSKVMGGRPNPRSPGHATVALIPQA
jgi:hypothetical protein